jgi:hypothetical protein
MRERVVFEPLGYLSVMTGGIRSIPAISTFLDEVEAHFDVVMPATPESEGSPFAKPQAPAPGARPLTLREALTDGAHLVTMGWQVPEALSALDGHDGAGSFVALGFQPTTATLRSAGMGPIADALDRFTAEADRSCYGLTRLLYQGLEESALRAIVADLDRNIDQERRRVYTAYISNLDQVRDRPRVDVPTLYLHSPLDLGGVKDLFLRIVPHAEVGKLESFPTRMQETDSGSEAARHVIEFIQRHAARN